ncbi:MAG: isochorismatase family cysteine hydrolase [Comamonadaceae bacterium]|nr:isochorismatase family cysteine hydrolase [Comamonadaceae bacterium]
MAAPRSLPRTKFPRSKNVLLLVDVINPLDFPTAHQLLPSAMQAAQAIAKLKQRLVRQGAACIYANDNYGTWHSEFSDILHACQELPGQRGKLARMLAPAPEDLVILKPMHSAFHSTPLQHLLMQIQAQQLIIVGLAADMCVMLSATDARMLGYRVWVPSDCTAAETPLRKEQALRQLQQVFKCSVRKSGRSHASAGS